MKLMEMELFHMHSLRFVIPTNYIQYFEVHWRVHCHKAKHGTETCRNEFRLEKEKRKPLFSAARLSLKAPLTSDDLSWQ